MRRFCAALTVLTFLASPVTADEKEDADTAIQEATSSYNAADFAYSDVLSGYNSGADVASQLLKDYFAKSGNWTKTKKDLWNQAYNSGNSYRSSAGSNVDKIYLYCYGNTDSQQKKLSAANDYFKLELWSLAESNAVYSYEMYTDNTAGQIEQGYDNLYKMDQNFQLCQDLLDAP